MSRASSWEPLEPKKRRESAMTDALAPKPRTRRALAALTGSLLAFLALELAARGGFEVREVGPSFSEWHPEDGIHVRRSIDVRRIHPEFTMAFRSNADGYRGPELPGRVERSILCLGDSFTMGYGVDDELCFPARLAERAPKDWTVVNAGIGGTGNGRWLRVLEREHERLRPKFVVLQLCDNDPGDNLTEALYSLDEHGALVSHPPAAPSVSRRVQAWIDRVPGVSYLHVVGLARQVAKRGAIGGPPPSDSDAGPRASEDAPPGLELTLALVRAAIERVRALGAAPILLQTELRPRFRAALESLAAETNTPCLRAPTMTEHPELYFARDGHWNAAGHAEVAELVWNELEARLADPSNGR
jgi:lysophospholipase L1-like esterase